MTARTTIICDNCGGQIFWTQPVVQHSYMQFRAFAASAGWWSDGAYDSCPACQKIKRGDPDV